jgi:hypothetical protein
MSNIINFFIVLGALSSFGQLVLLFITVWRSHFKNIPMTVVWETNPPNEKSEAQCEKSH